MVLAQIVTGDWPSWERKLWQATSTDPKNLTLRQLLSIAEGILNDGRDAQGREHLEALYEDRLPINLSTGKVAGLESENPDVRHATRLKMLEQRRKEMDRGRRD